MKYHQKSRQYVHPLVNIPYIVHMDECSHIGTYTFLCTYARPSGYLDLPNPCEIKEKTISTERPQPPLKSNLKAI